jgi:hypothetical protein
VSVRTPQRLTEAEIREATAQLPDYLKSRLSNYNTLLEERELLQEKLGQYGWIKRQLLKMMSFGPDQFTRRIEELSAQLKGLDKVIRALELGYEPYTPPNTWWVGLPERERVRYGWTTIDGRTGADLRLFFRAGVPPDVREKYRRAEMTGLFTQFVIAAPDRELFENQPRLRTDPVLIGYVKTDLTSLKIFHPAEQQMWNIRIGPGVLVEGGCGFKIAAWDYGEDRKRAGLSF